MDRPTPKMLANVLTDYVNTYSTEKISKDFIDAFCVEHRTLQQSSFRMILSLIEHMASDNYITDGRNKASHKIAKKLIDGFKKVLIEEELAMGVSLTEAEKNVNSDMFKPSKFLPHI